MVLDIQIDVHERVICPACCLLLCLGRGLGQHRSMTVSWATSEAVRRNMQAIKRRDTSIELSVRRGLHAVGWRFRVDFPPTPIRNKADIVFTRRRVAVFIDGCFWHRCPEHFKPPKQHTDYWGPKMERNVERDKSVTSRLEGAGWLVLRYWAHEPVDTIIADIGHELESR
jgi:DNA mismatch endonuclease (patch repair protein)